MKQISRTIRIALPLAACFSFWAGYAHADAPLPLRTLSADLQAPAWNETHKSLSKTLAQSPAITALAGAPRNFAGRPGAKRLRIDPRLKFALPSRNQLSMPLRALALHLGESAPQALPVKRFDAQVSAKPIWK